MHGGLIHLRVEVERHAEHVGGAQGAALMRQIRKRGRQVAAAEPEGGAVEVFFAGELEAERAHVGLARAPQHDRMVVALLDAAQIERVVGLVADQKAEAIDIEGARAAEVAHAELDMACAHDIERRVENGFADRHAVAAGVDGWLRRLLTHRADGGSPGESTCGLQAINLRGRPSFGAVVGDGIVDLRARLSRFATLLEVFRAQALDQAKAAVAGVRPDVPLAEVELLPPLPAPEKILCIGINYKPTASATTTSPSRRNIRACSIARRIRWSAAGKN